MRKKVLYPVVPIVGIDFSGVKKHTVPNQSMTLKTILKRFIKRESLPIVKEGTYHDGDYDLEKLMDADIFDRHEVLEEIKKDVEVKRKKVEAEREAKKPPVATPAPTSDPAPPVAPPSTPPA